MLRAIATTCLAIAVTLQIGCSKSAEDGDELSEELEDLRSGARQPTGDTRDAATEEQSFEEAMRLVCDAPNAVSADIKDPAQRQYEMAHHVQTRLKNREVIEMFQALATASPVERGPLLREQAERAGLEDCPLADL